MIPITIAPDELGDLMEAQENGEEFVSKNTVSELPENFNQWYDANRPRLYSKGSQPSFISENTQLVQTGDEVSGDNSKGETKALPRVINWRFASTMEDVILDAESRSIKKVEVKD